jgi:hypothetical protein
MHTPVHTVDALADRPVVSSTVELLRTLSMSKYVLTAGSMPCCHDGSNVYQ